MRDGEQPAMESTAGDEDSVDAVGRRDTLLRGVLPGDPTQRRFDGRRVVLGRSPECDVLLEFDRVSRAHAEIYAQGPVLALRDLGSTNGSFVDGRLAEHAVLKAGSVVRLGDWVGMVELLPERGRAVAFGELLPGVFGGSVLERLVTTLRRLAPSDLPIELVGPTGTGKERIARAIHAESGREGRFQAINCAALPQELAEAELFGYRKGAFTGATQAHVGHFREAHRGTLFLDEIAELAPRLQAKLLRALAEHQVTPLGETRPVTVDVRVICAGQIALEELGAQHAFRDDLRARLSAVRIHIPPLSERRGDVPALFHHFLRRYAPGRVPAVSSKLYERLCLHDWPLNVRELESLARLMLALHGDEERLRRSHLPAELAPAKDSATASRDVFETRRAHDLARLQRALESTDGNIKRAAEQVGISRQRAHRLLGSPKALGASGGGE